MKKQLLGVSLCVAGLLSSQTVLAQTKDSLNWTKRWESPYAQIQDFNPEGLALVREDEENYMLVDTNGRVISEKMYDVSDERYLWATAYFEAFVAKRAGKPILVAANGQETDLSLYDAYLYEGGKPYCKVMKNKRWGTVDVHTSTILLPMQYDSVLSMRGSVAIVREKDWLGMVNKRGGVIVPFEYKSIEYPTNGLSLVGKPKNNGEMQYGWVNTEDENAGKVVISCKYESAKDFDKGMAAVQNGGEWGCIDNKGETVIPFKYKSISRIEADWMIVRDKEDSLGVIDMDNKVIAPCSYETILSADGDYVKFEKNDSIGMLNQYGRQIIPPVYKRLYKFTTAHIAAINQQGMYGLINIKNDTLLPFIYKDIDVYITRAPKKIIYIQLRNKDNTYTVCTPDLKPILEGASLVSNVFCENSIDENRIVIQKNGKSGIMTFAGDWIVALQDSVQFYEGMCGIYRVSKKGEMGYYLADEKLNFFTKIPFENLSYVEQNRWSGSRDGKFMILDQFGNVYNKNVLPYSILDYQFGYLLAGFNRYDATILLDANEKVLIPQDSACTHIKVINEDWVFYYHQKSQKSFLYAPKTKEKIDLATKYKYTSAYFNAEKLSTAFADLRIKIASPNTDYEIFEELITGELGDLEELKGLKNKAGETLIPPTMTKISEVWNGTVYVKSEKHQGIIKIK
jgi:hypothetical protein